MSDGSLMICQACGNTIGACTCAVSPRPLTEDESLFDLARAIRNRCDILLLLQRWGSAGHLIPTILEDLYQDSQTLVDRYCVDD
jgi:hypothetical protein